MVWIFRIMSFRKIVFREDILRPVFFRVSYRGGGALGSPPPPRNLQSMMLLFRLAAVNPLYCFWLPGASPLDPTGELTAPPDPQLAIIGINTTWILKLPPPPTKKILYETLFLQSRMEHDL